MFYFFSQLLTGDAGEFELKQIPLDDVNNIHDKTGRASYVGEIEKKTFYLYFSLNVGSNGRWVLNDKLGDSETAISFIDSFSIEPHLIPHVNDNPEKFYWQFADSEQNWGPNESIRFSCIDEDDSSIIFFESSIIQSSLTGFYIERFLSIESPTRVYSLVGQHPSVESLYLFKDHNNTQWLIGEKIGEDSGYAFIRSNTASPVELVGQNWNFIDLTGEESVWIVGEPKILHKSMKFAEEAEEFSSIYEVVRFAHSVKTLPKGQTFLSLRNMIALPVVGLGTGGINIEHSANIFEKAIQSGYRFFDLAREYHNEDLLSVAIINGLNKNEENIYRDDLFIQSKVWPTELGYFPTIDAIHESLTQLKTSYIDSYLIHWPEYVFNCCHFFCRKLIVT